MSDFSAQAMKSFSVQVCRNNILLIAYLKSVNGDGAHIRRAEAIRESVFEIYSKNPEKRYDILVDTSALSVQPRIASRARKIYAELAAHAQTRRVSVSGHHAFYKAVVGSVAANSGKRIGWFSSPTLAMSRLGR